MRKRLNNRQLFGYWQLVAPVWKRMALKCWFSAGYLATAFACKAKNVVSLQDNCMTDDLKYGIRILTI